MLSFDIRSLEARAAQVAGALDPDDPIWEEADPRPSGPIRVEGRLSPAGQSRFYLSGRMSGTVALECRRCLTAVSEEVNDELHAVFAPSGDTEVDDPDVFEFDPGGRELDLRPAVRESWLLAVPAFAECREDCKGLCPTCGADLNEGECGCEPARDSRWDALRKPAGRTAASGEN